MVTAMIQFVLLARIVAASITCLQVGQSATATWTDSAKRTCTWTGIVGNNFGINQSNQGNYSCNGRCGAGCNEGPFGGRLGNAYTQDCWSHDICSWFNNAKGGSKDVNCGKAFDEAQDDYILGIASGCGSRNSDFAPRAPTTVPICK